jgi:sorbitol/mannitol transport system permease protein
VVTAHSRGAARLMISPTALLPPSRMLVPLSMPIWFSVQRCNLLVSGMERFAQFDNYQYFLPNSVLLFYV